MLPLRVYVGFLTIGCSLTIRRVENQQRKYEFSCFISGLQNLNVSIKLYRKIKLSKMMPERIDQLDVLAAMRDVLEWFKPALSYIEGAKQGVKRGYQIAINAALRRVVEDEAKWAG